VSIERRAVVGMSSRAIVPPRGGGLGLREDEVYARYARTWVTAKPCRGKGTNYNDIKVLGGFPSNSAVL
jgi:hypothetical protein